MASTIAKLWAMKIIDGTKTYSEVPSKLKPDVKDLLIEAGREDLVIE